MAVSHVSRLTYAEGRESNEIKFYDKIREAYRESLKQLGHVPHLRQEEQCISIIEFMRR
jgi:hypothetical protein